MCCMTTAEFGQKTATKASPTVRIGDAAGDRFRKGSGHHKIQRLVVGRWISGRSPARRRGAALGQPLLSHPLERPLQILIQHEVDNGLRYAEIGRTHASVETEDALPYQLTRQYRNDILYPLHKKKYTCITYS